MAILDVVADPEVRVPLTAISAHLNPYSVLAAAPEAQLLAARLYRYGGMGVIGSDINHIPPRRRRAELGKHPHLPRRAARGRPDHARRWLSRLLSAASTTDPHPH
ncbi:hypothetical protein D0T12_31375 [Actinomadura spongiicola]|uniref:Uncharacterized protein n=1 Tax=Actinomadura spongiicola TaxID=2303421 RepID=A0A372G8Q1_9ACTN|nr:hypothetical protein D0T12_31375 [Actinomadura spongiicola]